MIKELTHVMLELHNMRIELSNVRKKKVNEPPNVIKRTVTCDIGITQYEDETVKCEKKIKEPPNVTKELTHVMLELHNMRMKPLNVRKKK